MIACSITADLAPVVVFIRNQQADRQISLTENDRKIMKNIPESSFRDAEWMIRGAHKKPSPRV